MQLLLLLGALATLLSPAYALYFYLEGSQMRCFLEDLPKDTLVVGMLPLMFPRQTPDRLPTLEDTG
jgi:hypothetical protein